MKPPGRKLNIHCKASHKRLFLSVWTCNYIQTEYHYELPRTLPHYVAKICIILTMIPQQPCHHINCKKTP